MRAAFWSTTYLLYLPLFLQACSADSPYRAFSSAQVLGFSGSWSLAVTWILHTLLSYVFAVAVLSFVYASVAGRR